MTRTLEFKAAYENGGWKSPFFVTLDADGRILEKSESIAGPSEKVDGYLLPGLANAHSHSFQYAMAGMAERIEGAHDDFWVWRDQMYRLANQITADELRAVTTQLYRRCLENGYTSVCEFHYLHHDPKGQKYQQPSLLSEVLMESARNVGIHLTLIPIYYNQSAPGVPILEKQKRFYSAGTDEYLALLEEIESVARDRYENVTVGYGVHSMRAASAGDMKVILGKHWTTGPCHLHASEQVKDVESFEAAYRARPIDWLYDNIPLDGHHNLVHATHMLDSEIQKLVKAQTTVVVCHTTEANLGDGIFPIADFHSRGGSWCVGSDSHVNLNPFLEIQGPELTQRLLTKKRNVFCTENAKDSGKILFDRVWSSGRRSMGLSPEAFSVGELFEGIVLDPDHDRLLERPLDSVMGILHFANEQSMIRDVWCTGKQRVKDGKHANATQYKGDFQRAMKSLMAGL